MKLDTLSSHLPSLDKFPELTYKVYLATLEQTPVVVIDLIRNHPQQPEDLPIYSALYPLALLSDEEHKEFKQIQEAFEDYLEIYAVV